MTLKKLSPTEYRELVTDELFCENGLATCGMFRGLPYWVGWFVAERDSDIKHDDYDTYYVVETERNGFPELADAVSVSIRCIDRRNVAREERAEGFVFELVNVVRNEKLAQDM